MSTKTTNAKSPKVAKASKAPKVSKAATAKAAQAEAEAVAAAPVAPVAPAKAPKAPAIVQHGVQRPGQGLCLAVWELTEAEMATAADGTVTLPSIGAVREKGLAQGLNPTNVSIEYYRCRAFHGVRGRQAKAPVADAPKA